MPYIVSIYQSTIRTSSNKFNLPREEKGYHLQHWMVHLIHAYINFNNLDRMNIYLHKFMITIRLYADI